ESWSVMATVLKPSWGSPENSSSMLRGNSSTTSPSAGVPPITESCARATGVATTVRAPTATTVASTRRGSMGEMITKVLLDWAGSSTGCERLRHLPAGGAKTLVGTGGRKVPGHAAFTGCCSSQVGAPLQGANRGRDRSLGNVQEHPQAPLG